MKRLVLTLTSLCVSCGHLCAADTWVAFGYGGRRMISHDRVKWEITAEWAAKGGDDSNNPMGAAFGKGKPVVEVLMAALTEDDVRAA